MHYVAILNNEETEVEISELSPGHYRVVLNEDAHNIDAQFISSSTLSLISENQSHCIETEDNPEGGVNLRVLGKILRVEMLDMRAVRLRRAQNATATFDGPLPIKSPTPGKVVKILVQENQKVAEGDGLLIIEAMKMENELRAPKAGTIKSIDALEGATVESGTNLCVLE